MLRDVLLLVLFCLFSVAFHVFGQERQRRVFEQQETLHYRLGSPEMLSESPRRCLLEGRFEDGLLLHPEPEIYRELANLFLARDPEVSAMAVTPVSMGRIHKGELQLFTAQGAPWKPVFHSLGEEIKPQDVVLTGLKPPFQLEAEDDWLLYRDADVSIALRPHRDKLLGYRAEGKIELEDNRLKLGETSWTFRQGKLEPTE